MDVLEIDGASNRGINEIRELRENVRQTVFHEVGHYFGFDEEELQRFEKGDF